MPFAKNGIITGIAIESLSQKIGEPFTIKYTPAKATTNSCMEQYPGAVTPGETYTAIATVSWKFTSFPDGFNCWMQGAQHHVTNGWGWTTGSLPNNALTNAIVAGTGLSFVNFIKQYPSYSKRIAGEFTAGQYYDGYSVGCRTDNADGTSWFEIRDCIIVPSKYYTGIGTNQSGNLLSLRINDSELIGDNFIEY